MSGCACKKKRRDSYPPEAWTLMLISCSNSRTGAETKENREIEWKLHQITPRHKKQKAGNDNDLKTQISYILASFTDIRNLECLGLKSRQLHVTHPCHLAVPCAENGWMSMPEASQRLFYQPRKINLLIFFLVLFFFNSTVHSE